MSSRTQSVVCDERKCNVSGARTGACVGVGNLPSSQTLHLGSHHPLICFFVLLHHLPYSPQHLALSSGSGVQPGDRPSRAGVGELGWRLHLHQPERCPATSAGVWEQRQAVRHVCTCTHTCTKYLSPTSFIFLAAGKPQVTVSVLNKLGLIT